MRWWRTDQFDWFSVYLRDRGLQTALASLVIDQMEALAPRYAEAARRA